MSDKELTTAFLEEMGNVANKYKSKGIPAGVLMGALEVVKFRIFSEAEKQIEGLMKKKEADGEWSSAE